MTTLKRELEADLEEARKESAADSDRRLKNDRVLQLQIMKDIETMIFVSP